MRAVLNKEHGLPHEKLITDIAITELPWYHKLLFFADGGLVVYPTLEQKAAMIRLIVDSMHRLGYGDHIKVGILCAAETFSPKIQESVDAVELKRMNREGEITGCIVEGPISLDLAMKPDVARAKPVSYTHLAAPPMYMPKGHVIPLAKEVKKAVGIPVSYTHLSEP